MGCDSSEDELDQYSDGDDGDDWDIDDVAVDSRFDVRASLCRYFDAFCDLCRSVNIVVPEDVIEVFSIALHILNAITEHDSTGAAKDSVLQRVHVIEETAASSHVAWTLEKINMGFKRIEWLTTVERPNTDLATACQEVFRETALQSKLCNFEDAYFRFSAW